MSINLMGSKLGQQLQKAVILDEATAWIEAFDQTLRREIIVEWLQRDQLFTQGIDADGLVLGTYSPLTEQWTEGRKKAGDRYNLFDQGDFYASTYIIALANEIIIDADSEKMEGQDWWRNAILGLTDENLTKLAERVKEKYIDYVRRLLGIA